MRRLAQLVPERMRLYSSLMVCIRIGRVLRFIAPRPSRAALCCLVLGFACMACGDSRREHMDLGSAVAIDLAYTSASAKPSYSVQIATTGVVQFTLQKGDRNNTLELSIDEGDMLALVSEFERLGFWEMDDRYSMETNDLPCSMITVRSDGVAKTVSNYWVEGDEGAWTSLHPQFGDANWEAHRGLQKLADLVVAYSGVAIYL